MYVIATAGHVDHGKSALVKALTGTDPDRLQEEKARGLTIDLGFAHFPLPNGEEVSIVDVPGHERFVKNMLAGVGGIDLVLLLIAANEGVKPQTVEHLAILDLLGVKPGIVVLSKADLAIPGQLEEMRREASGLISGTSLRDAPIVPCSAATGSGLDDLLAEMATQLSLAPRRPDTGRPRLPIDRAFKMAGFGTVVTGTLVDGSLEVGQAVAAYPEGLRTRIRGLQHNGRDTKRASPGSRTAVNLVGVAVEQLHRGMVLALPEALYPVLTVNARVTAVRYLPRPLRHNTSVRFHCGAAEVGARLILLERASVDPGESGWGQIRLRQPVAVLPGDRFILRDPNGTVGGGQIFEINPPRRRAKDWPQDLAETRTQSNGQLFLAALRRLEPAELSQVARAAGLGAEEALEEGELLVNTGQLVLLHSSLTPSATVLTPAGLDILRERVEQILASYHESATLEPGMRREELRSRLSLEPAPFDNIYRRLTAEGTIKKTQGRVSLAKHEPTLSPEQRAEAERYLAALLAEPYAPPANQRPPADLLGYLERQGTVVRAGDIFFHREAYDQMVQGILARIKTEGSITLSSVRDMFGTSRRYAQALLEHLDYQRITRRVGDERVLR